MSTEGHAAHIKTNVTWYDSPRCCFIPFIGWKFDASMHTSVRCIGEINRWIKQRTQCNWLTELASSLRANLPAGPHSTNPRIHYVCGQHPYKKNKANYILAQRRQTQVKRSKFLRSNFRDNAGLAIIMSSTSPALCPWNVSYKLHFGDKKQQILEIQKFTHH